MFSGNLIMAGNMVVRHELSCFIFSTKSSGAIGVAVYKIERRSFPESGIMSLLIASINFSTASALLASCAVCISSRIAYEGRKLPRFNPRIPLVTPRQEMTEPEVGISFPFASFNLANTSSEEFFSRSVETPLYNWRLLNEPFAMWNGAAISG